MYIYKAIFVFEIGSLTVNQTRKRSLVRTLSITDIPANTNARPETRNTRCSMPDSSTIQPGKEHWTLKIRHIYVCLFRLTSTYVTICLPIICVHVWYK